VSTVRRRSKPSPLSRLRSFWVVALCAFAALAGTVVYALNWPGFRFGALEVAGNALVPRSEIVARAAFESDRNIWLLDTRAAERRIEQIPYVREAHVRRTFPNAVGISVVERAPEACLVTAGDSALTIDADRRVLESECERVARPLFRLPSLPAAEPGAFVRSEALVRLQQDAKSLRRETDPFVSFAYDRYGGLLATLESGIEVRFGSEADLAQKVRLLDAILARPGTAAQLRAIDLRAPAAPVVLRREPQHIQDSTPAHHNI
jgi:cell division protein FtsQ